MNSRSFVDMLKQLIIGIMEKQNMEVKDLSRKAIFKSIK